MQHYMLSGWHVRSDYWSNPSPTKKKPAGKPVTAMFHKAYDFSIALAKALVLTEYSITPLDLCKLLALPGSTSQYVATQDLTENTVTVFAYILDQWARKIDSSVALSTLKGAFSDKPAIQETITKLTEKKWCINWTRCNRIPILRIRKKDGALFAWCEECRAPAANQRWCYYELLLDADGEQEYCGPSTKRSRYEDIFLEANIMFDEGESYEMIDRSEEFDRDSVTTASDCDSTENSTAEDPEFKVSDLKVEVKSEKEDHPEYKVSDLKVEIKSEKEDHPEYKVSNLKVEVKSEKEDHPEVSEVKVEIKTEDNPHSDAPAVKVKVEDKSSDACGILADCDEKSIFDEKPKASDFLSITWRDSGGISERHHYFKVKVTFADDWQKIATMLGIPKDHIKKLGRGRSDADGCYAMLSHWVTVDETLLSAVSVFPVTWRGLIKAMSTVVDLEKIKLLNKALFHKVDT